MKRPRLCKYAGSCRIEKEGVRVTCYFWEFGRGFASEIERDESGNVIPGGTNFLFPERPDCASNGDPTNCQLPDGTTPELEWVSPDADLPRPLP